MNLGMILAIVAVWLWYCLVMYSEEGAPLSAAVFIPILVPFLWIDFLVLLLRQLQGVAMALRVVADAERRIDQ